MRNAQRKTPNIAKVSKSKDFHHSRDRFRLAGIDAQKFRTRMGAAYDIGVQHSGKIDVIDEHPFSGQKLIIFRALEPRAYESREESVRVLLSFRISVSGSRSFHDCIHDILVAGTATQIARERFANFGLAQPLSFCNKALAVVRTPGVQKPH